MTPAHLLLHITGTPWRKHFSFMHPQWQYRPISQINQTAPLTITVPAHGLPAENWPVWIEGTTANSLNADKSRAMFRMARVIDPDTLEFNDINGAKLKASGGHIAYQSPMDFTGCTARMVFYNCNELVLTATDIVLSLGGLDIELTGDISGANRYDLFITHANGDDIKWLCGEVTHDNCC